MVKYCEKTFLHFVFIPALSKESSGVLLVTVLNFQIAKKLS